MRELDTLLNTIHCVISVRAAFSGLQIQWQGHRTPKKKPPPGEPKIGKRRPVRQIIGIYFEAHQRDGAFRRAHVAVGWMVLEIFGGPAKRGLINGAEHAIWQLH